MVRHSDYRTTGSKSSAACSITIRAPVLAAIRTRLRPDALLTLQRRELLDAGRTLATELGKPFTETAPGHLVEGTLRRPVDLVGGRFALVERAQDFTLVPWRPVLERRLGNQVSGLRRSDGVNWRFGRARSEPEIS
ncbi:DUF3363 domain-containing protein [Sphingomonas oryzagri]